MFSAHRTPYKEKKLYNDVERNGIIRLARRL